jgi:hypothetical protein
MTEVEIDQLIVRQLLTVPCVSFIIDLSRRVAVSRRDWFWRVPLELFVAVPVWFYFRVFFEVLFLGWVWI